MEASLDTIIEVREELMVSPSTGQNLTSRTAYFLKPCIKESPSDILPPHSMLLSPTITSSPAKKPLEVRHNGWLGPFEEWKTWVTQMQSKYEPLWIKAGIDQAIKASTYQINRNNELILGLAQRWCSKTNTFIFPWGEATITLEDIKFFGNYSICGDPIFTPLETQEQKETEKKLVAARRIFNSTKCRKVKHKPWMMYFMKNESQVEHEAFLSLWLSRFVFPANSHNTILKNVFPIAIHLARGTRIALAPSVLASIYRDLTLLNNNIIGIATIKLGVITLWAPFQLIQIWALERFQSLQPHPHAISQIQPRMARWHKVKIPRIKNLKFILDSAGARNLFLWQPYKNSPSFRLYYEECKLECDDPSIESELQSFALCLRVSELVGNMGCKEQYFPHRVAMQFGMDQDIPDMVVPCHKDPWINYSQSVVVDRNLRKALCCRQCQPNVTSRYYDWWKQSKPGKEGDRKIKDFDHCVTSISRSENLSPASSLKVDGEVSGSYGPPPGFTSKFKRDNQMGDFDQEGHEILVNELLSSTSEVKCFEDEVVGNGKALSSPQYDETATSMAGGVYNFAKSDYVLRGSKSTMEECQKEDVVRGARARKAKDDDGNEARRKSSFCDTNCVYDIEGEGVSSCIVEDIASNLENRILELERVVVKLKAAKFGHKVENIGAKAMP